MGSNSVTKHNELIQAGYRLSLNETRIVLYGISLINPLAKDFPLEYEVNVKKFIKLFGLEDNKNVYALIKEAVMDRFWEREFTVDVGEEHKKRFRWLIGIEYADRKGYLKVFMNPLLKPFLHQLTGHFTSYHLEQIASFQSVSSVRLYELCMMHLNKSGKDKCSFILKIDEIKEQLDLTEKYKRFSNLKSFVLEYAKKEINKFSDITFSYKVIKLGRSPVKIDFHVTRKAPKQELKSLSNNALSPPILDKATWLAEGARTGWNIEELEKQFWAYSQKQGTPRNIENAFLGFVRKKILKPA